MRGRRALEPLPWGLIAVAIVGALTGIWRSGLPIHLEDDLLEMVQIGLLGLIGLTALRGLLAARRPGDRIAAVGLALAATTAIFRELDLEYYDVAAWIRAVGAGDGRDVTLGVSWLVLFAAVARWRRDVGSLIRTEIRRPSGRLLAIGCAAYLLAQPLDGPILDLTEAQRWFLEETIEVVACWFLFGGTLALARRLAGVEPDTVGGLR